tara:strand:+ start:122 stop:715 length:594 start_codon:yes stop_codon:yes gene_type:complete
MVKTIQPSKMNNAYKVGLVGSSIYIAFELLLVIIGWNHHHYAHVASFAFNSLCLLIIVAYSILTAYNKIKHTSPSLIEDIKNGLKTSSIYAIIISVFIFSYYQWIDPSYPEIKKQQLLELTIQKEMSKIADEKMKENPDLYYNKSKEDLIEMQQDNIIDIMEPSKVFPITLFSLLMLGMVFSFLITALNRAVLSKIS